MTSGLNMGILVTFPEIFDETPEELDLYLKGIGKDKLLITAALFLGLDNVESEFDNYKDLLTTFFCAENS